MLGCQLNVIIFLVFMSPETVQQKAWREVLSGPIMKERLVCVAIDEAHCVAEWLVIELHVCSTYLNI